MTKEFIEGMISSNVHLINISIESLDEERFEYITQNKKFKEYNYYRTFFSKSQPVRLMYFNYFLIRSYFLK